MYASPLYTVDKTSFKFEVLFWVVMLPLKGSYLVNSGLRRGSRGGILRE